MSARARRDAFALLAGALLLASSAAQAQSAARLVEARCARCHGIDGLAADAATPRLAGLSAGYLARQLRAFAEGRRRDEEMSQIAAELNDAEQLELARWYASRKPPPPGSSGPQADQGRRLYEDGTATAQACTSCHQPDGSGTTQFPRLSGQSKPYLIKQMTEFKAGRRSSDAQMAAIAQALSASEIRALADHISGL